MKKAIVIGINGQDGSYLSEWLVRNEYQVLGWVRPARLNSIDISPNDNNKVQIWEIRIKILKSKIFLYSSSLVKLQNRFKKYLLLTNIYYGYLIR